MSVTRIHPKTRKEPKTTAWLERMEAVAELLDGVPRGNLQVLLLEICEFFRVSPETVRLWLCTGIPHARRF